MAASALQAAPEDAPASAHAPNAVGAGQWYAVILLTATYLVSFMDRQILALLVEPIKADLGISDTSMGLIQGVAFGLFFTLAGIPMGWLADRVARRKLLAVAITVWSGLTAACGFAGNAAQLFLARTGVGIGEAALGPCAAPMIREIFPKERVVTALSIYMLGIPLGGGVALLLGAVVLPWTESMGGLHLPLLGALKPWQATFLIVALPGFVLAALMLTIREPVRAKAGTPGGAAPVRDVARYMMRHWKSFVGFGLPGITAMFLTFGIGFWLPAAFQRTYGLDQAAVADYLKIWGLMTIGFGIVGTLTGGMLADAMRRRRDDGYVLHAILGIALLAVSFGSFPLMPTPELALAALTPAALAVALPPVAATAAAMELIPRQMRSLAFAAWMMLVSLLGMSSGPAVIGFVTDHVFGSEDQLRFAIPLCAAIGAAFAIPLLLAVRRSYHTTMLDAARISAEAEPIRDSQ